jgi:virginiamycin B lyase
MRNRLVAAISSLLLTVGATAVLSTVTATPAVAADRINVPTSAAGLGRIVGSPDGSIWFVEKDANKIGRIAGGQVSEYAFPATDSSQVKDLDVAPDGTVWVIWDSGRYASHLNQSFGVIKSWKLGDYPYGEQVRVGADGRAWVTMSYDYQSIAVLTDAQAYELPNAPECDDSLAIGHDGAIWCRTGNSSITNVNPTGGGAAYPAGNFAAWPYALAAGPTGRIWFGRYTSGTFYTSPSDGEVGYLDASGNPVAFDTGDRTAPGDLVQGPDGSMYFTSIGAAKGIGHISKTGKGGSLTQIGGYEPEHLTFGTDGYVYATDSQNNAILRVSPKELGGTNVDPGEGSVLFGNLAGNAKVGKNVALRRGAVPLTVACPKDALQACTGKARLVTASKKKPKTVSKTVKYKLAPGKRRAVALKLTGKGLKAVPKKGAVKLQVQLLAGKTPASTKTIKVHR